MSAFGSNFWWGSATAAYQIEGAAQEGGRGSSIWDTFSHTPGNVANGDTGDIADDHYHRWPEDIALIQQLGLNAYRFSISWPRIFPDGMGSPNREGIEFYRRLAVALRQADIAPVATLYHWDLPQRLQDRGGWANRDTTAAFADYADLLARELGDVIEVWTTLNEPWCSAYLGYASGVHAPGITDPAQAFASVHHLNLAHGLAAQAIRGVLSEARVSVTLNLHLSYPENPAAPEDVAAAHDVEVIGNEVFLGPMLEGRLPDGLVDLTKDHTDWAFVRDGDMADIHQPLDVLGLNYYSTNTVRRRKGFEPTSSGGHGDGSASPWPGCEDIVFLPPRGPLTAMGWNIDPAGLTELIIRTARRWPDLPLMVTENGAAFPDEVAPNGVVHDQDRIDYLLRHFAAAEDAIKAGADLRGYFVWSLLDNFEWAWGYEKRFGLIYVDYPTGTRIPKSSYAWYANQIAAHRR